MERSRHNFLSFWTIFCPSTPAPPPPNNNPQSQNFEKMKKIPGDIIILHMCTIKMTVILCKIPEIWSTTDRIFCHSGPFFSLLPPDDPEFQNFEKIK